MNYSQFAAETQFFLYGKRHCTSTGYQRTKASYEEPSLVAEADLAGKTFIVTGANSGLGFELSRYLARQGAKLFMFCRSPQRAEAARERIVSHMYGYADPSNVKIIQCDAGLEASVRAAWEEFQSQNERLDGLVCNAGALLNEKQLTAEGIEVTFASHLLYGTYLLGSLAMQMLEATPDSRLITVSSGGMYRTKFPEWEVATAQVGEYSGEKAYCYAKRGQVLLMERWTQEHPNVKCVSCHPGWTETPGVDDAFGDKKEYLQPLRSPWEGAEGIAWLCVAEGNKIQGGEFYLDRSPSVKHIAGPFFSEGSYTKNSTAEVDEMMHKLQEWSQQLPSAEEREAAVARTLPLTASTEHLELERFMGRWYVLAGVPTFVEQGVTDPIEDYSLDSKSGNIQVDFSYSKLTSLSQKKRSERSHLYQRARVVNSLNTEWTLSPKLGVYLPLGLPYLVVECAKDYSTTIIGMPGRDYCWIMARTPAVDEAVLQALVQSAVDKGYERERIVYYSQDGNTIPRMDTDRTTEITAHLATMATTRACYNWEGQ